MTKIQVEFNPVSSSPLKRGDLEKIFSGVLEETGFSFPGKTLSLSVANVSLEEMAGLNRERRKKDGPTDVLSFAEFSNRREISERAGEVDNVFLGEVILCYNDIEEYCRREKKEPEKETAEVFAHGVLHLLGFPHGREMFEIQKKAAEKFSAGKSGLK